METRPNFIHTGKGEIIEMPGIKMLVKINSQESGGKLSMIEQDVEPGSGSLLHICNHEDKVIHVLDGEFEVYVNGEIIEPDLNGTIFIRKGLPHYYRNVGCDAGKIMVIITPGGHENFLRDLSLTIDEHGIDKGKMFEAAKRNNVLLL